ncbi:MAG: cytochrome ubiquinol oxidase subunit I [Actinobacteria bacterium]|nr:cytochrome ubiquinol oxidase subunit I [Actinomycetota bacterium]MCG9477688.1 cytochrome ubiquinol oxidase subunit I [Actinomycetes bacterium]HBU02660.1 cytochrome ubiquinol oxidase subunit I [Acidimicrobiaceae bacterium]
MSVEVLHRIQFALTVSFHFIFPPLSLGLGLILIIFGVKSVRTNDPKWRQLSTFWVKIYGLIFSLGIATGIVQEFEFGTNWSRYSRFVGNIFGSLLAAEGIFAFMLEGGFLGLMLFGGTRLGNRMWLFATTMVVTGATFSAFWIVMANSWMQTPQGFEIRDVGRGPQAFMTSFSDVVFTPSFSARILHVIAASWMVGSSLVLSVGAYYLLKKRHVELAKTMIRVALPVFAVVALLQVAVFGANQATQVARDQPAKLAAMEGLYQTESCAPMFLLGWTNPDEEKTTGLHIPCLLSLLTTKNFDAPVTGLEATPREDWPNVSLVFQVYHVMINLGMLFVAIGLTACGFWIWKRKIWDQRWLLWVLVSTVVLTEIATIAGWWTAEFSRQPWIVWQVLRTEDAYSPNVTFAQVVFSIAMFVVLYIVVFVVFLRLLDRRIKEGPPPPQDSEETESLPDSFGEIFRRRSRVSSGGK